MFKTLFRIFGILLITAILIILSPLIIAGICFLIGIIESLSWTAVLAILTVFFVCYLIFG